MAVLSLEFANGAFATSSVTLGSRQEMSRLRFCFSDLVAESGLSPYNPGHDPWTFPDDDPAAAARIAEALADFAPLPERFTGQFHRLHAALTGDAPLPVTLADARRSIELLTAAYWSAATGEPVALPLPPDHPYYAGWIPRRPARPSMADLELRRVVKRFGAIEVIHGIDLHIEDGEFVVFVGPSGCGKSTLLRMIAGLEPISDGELLIDGAPVHDVPAAEARPGHGLPVLRALPPHDACARTSPSASRPSARRSPRSSAR